MDDPLEQPEMARRIRAAMAYAGPSFQIADAAKATNISPGHFPRYTSGRTDYTLSPAQLRALAAAIGIDPNFFTADFDRLSEIAEPVFRRLGAPSPPALPSELRRLPEDPGPSDETAWREEPESEADDQ